MQKIYKKIKDQQSGLSLILSIVVLMAIFGLVIVVTDVAMDISASNRAIGTSEVALFAAETAAELTIYDVEYNNAGYGLTILPNDQEIVLTNDSAWWNREIQLATSSPGLCNPADPTIAPSPVCSANLGTINTGNPLQVNLPNGRSFQLDLDIQNANDYYPTHVFVTNTSGGASRLLVLGRNAQVTHDPFNGTVSVPSSGTLDPADNFKIRIYNDSGSTQTYTINTQTGNDELPLGLEIRAYGRYQDTRRDIVLVRPAWLIY
jgi:hypothetical protein